MIEVSDDVYESVINPHKKKKAFGRLVVMLLEAYAYNDAIYSYINGAMDGIEEQATDELIKDLNSMAESLSMFSAYSDQMESVIDNGQKAFDDFGARASQDLGKEMSVGQPSTGLTREDVVSIVNDSVGELKDMLMQVLSGNVSTIQKPSVTVEKPRVVEPIAQVSEVKAEVSATIEEIPDITKEDEALAQNALSSLMGSIGW